MVAGGTLQHPAGIVNLAQDEIAGVGAAAGLAGRNFILRLPQQNIAAFLAHRAGQKAPLRREEAQVDAQTAALAHQGGGGTGVAEAEDAFQRVQRHSADFGLVAADGHIFAVQREVGAFVQHEQGVQELPHDVTSVAASSRWLRR